MKLLKVIRCIKKSLNTYPQKNPPKLQHTPGDYYGSVFKYSCRLQLFYIVALPLIGAVTAESTDDDSDRLLVTAAETVLSTD